MILFFQVARPFSVGATMRPRRIATRLVFVEEQTVVVSTNCPSMPIESGQTNNGQVFIAMGWQWFFFRTTMVFQTSNLDV